MKQTILRIIGEHLGRPIESSEPLISSGILDSIVLLDIAIDLEDAFGVSLADSEITVEHFDTVDTIEAYIASQLG